MINYKVMKRIFNKNTEQFGELPGFQTLSTNPNLFFQDNGSNVLGVAHLDSVQNSEHIFLSKKRIFSPVLDDRLGVYVLLHMLPKLDIKLDILFTDDEEKGKTTASLFKTKKKYNWIVEFDRKGSDVVMYKYRTAGYVSMLKKYFKEIGYGSYSDICALDHLGVFGFNIGVGYEDYHNINAYASIPTLLTNVKSFQRFYKKYQNTRLPYIKHSVSVYESTTKENKEKLVSYSYRELMEQDAKCKEYEDEYGFKHYTEKRGICFCCGGPTLTWRERRDELCGFCAKDWGLTGFVTMREAEELKARIIKGIGPLSIIV